MSELKKKKKEEEKGKTRGDFSLLTSVLHPLWFVDQHATFSSSFYISLPRSGSGSLLDGKLEEKELLVFVN